MQTREELAHLTASCLTVAAAIVRGNAPAPPDGKLTDADKLVNLFTWNTYQVFASGERSVLLLPVNDANWPGLLDDAPGGGNLPPSPAALVALLRTIVPGTPEATAILAQVGPILAALQAVVKPAGPIPAPGVTATAS